MQFERFLAFHAEALEHLLGEEQARLVDMETVGRTAVPVPIALGLCTDSEVNGAPFYVMSYVDGVVLDSPERAVELPVALRPRASGASSQRCANCGDRDHSMLLCPSNPKVI